MPDERLSIDVEGVDALERVVGSLERARADRARAERSLQETTQRALTALRQALPGAAGALRRGAGAVDVTSRRLLGFLDRTERAIGPAASLELDTERVRQTLETVQGAAAGAVAGYTVGKLIPHPIGRVAALVGFSVAGATLGFGQSARRVESDDRLRRIEHEAELLELRLRAVERRHEQERSARERTLRESLARERLRARPRNVLARRR